MSSTASSISSGWLLFRRRCGNLERDEAIRVVELVQAEAEDAGDAKRSRPRHHPGKWIQACPAASAR